MSLVARYHRGAPPKPSHKHYRKRPAAEQRRIRQLAALVRIAEGLDRSHFQNVTALRARLTDEALSLSLATKGDPQLEVWAGSDERSMFEAEFGRALEITPTTIETRTPTRPDPPVSPATSTAAET